MTLFKLGIAVGINVGVSRRENTEQQKSHATPHGPGVNLEETVRISETNWSLSTVCQVDALIKKGSLIK